MPSQEPTHLFVYGTLTDPERVTALTSKQFERVDATLSGFDRVNSPLGYPFILPSTGSVVRGLLLLNVDPASLVRFDAYEAEGDLYRRQGVVVTVAGRQVTAMTYVGYAIRASVAPTPAQWTDPGRPQGSPDPRTMARRLRAPLADEYR
jgi:gamma-glutamylcyclotransferase (GGCT)/AIG2-like uncharacterized protein YtfP